MSNLKEIVGHGKNYLIANIASRAIAFISLPVFTRILSPDDYGINSIFLGAALIVGSFSNLNVDKSISRYFYDKKSDEDFKQYIGTCFLVIATTLLISSFLLIYYKDFWANLLGLKTSLVFFIMPMILVNVVIAAFEQIYQPLKQSKLVAKFSTFRIYLSFLLSVPLVLLCKEDKYYGLIIGQILSGGIIIILILRHIKPFVAFSFSFKHLKYMLIYSIPLIPDVLSGTIIEQFGKLAIGANMGVANAGFYALAVSISSLVSIIVYVTNQAWVPYYFEYMNKKDYKSHDKDIKRIVIVTLVFALFIASYCKEIGLILAKQTYTEYLYLVPILVTGFVFYQIFFIYYRNISYSKKTIYMSTIVIISGIVNVLLNSILIPRVYELGAAISFLASYIVLAILAWITSKYIIRIYTTPIKLVLIPIMIYLTSIATIILSFKIDSYVISLLTRTAIVVVALLILLREERVHILEYYNKLKANL